MQMKGITASEGVAFGQAFTIRTAVRLPQETTTIKPSLVPSELRHFDMAVEHAYNDLNEIRLRLLAEARSDEAEILEVQLLLLKDDALIAVSRDKIERLLYTAQTAIEETTKEIMKGIQRLGDEYLEERAMDIEDVCRRIVRELRGESEPLEAIVDKEGLILICEDLTPSEAVRLHPKAVAGLVTATGGATSHAAIITRSMGIPAVVGMGGKLLSIQDGQWLLLNGTNGTLTTGTHKMLSNEYKHYIEKDKQSRATEDYGCLTTVEKKVNSLPIIGSNIGSLTEAQAARMNGAEGVGLFRTEFLFLGREDFPTEDEQFEAYRAVITTFDKGAPIVIRTMDVGGDKQLPSLRLDKEDNPFLGHRGIRISLNRLDLFRTQLRAVLRASHFGNVKLLFPMISTLNEWRRAIVQVEVMKSELKKEGIAFNEAMEIGMMIEVPAAALMVNRLADEVDFFSIGTNDLIQYTMAASRMTTHVNELNDPLQPAVISLIDHIITAAHEKGKRVGMCGEMAAHPLAAPLLLGMGLDEFSVGGAVVQPMRNLLGRYDREFLRGMSANVLNMDDVEEIRRYIERELHSSNSM
ncbi:phosphoenolpyruvate--protein phosphotransferase [Cohnella abietis]|uniref:Phosphoenolpyruvate-protein phosphotransferase n=1 Tax=Cohnella abietis TaxID=2507935 RepID=A0A3T1DCK6_9BACL|nr:phosphoenolpyruvate--protein phosphotransferase [Cohnella abietis]BBI35829.1 phosphoenolpyruvate-protein phosphotransferase [Cohnella abietis]